MPAKQASNTKQASRVIRVDAADAQWIRQTQAERMALGDNWRICAADVVADLVLLAQGKITRKKFGRVPAQPTP